MEDAETDAETDAEYLLSAKRILQELLSCPDELPEEYISGKGAYHRHKFRGNWLQGVASNVRLVAEICGDMQLVQDVIRFVKRRYEKGITKRTTREEIDEADQLIIRALKILNNIC